VFDRLASIVLFSTLTLFGCTESHPDQPNIILVAMDTIRWDHTSLGGYHRDTTPSLSQLAQTEGSTTFSRAYSTGSWSLQAYGGLFTGQDAVTNGMGLSTGSLNLAQSTLPEMLAAHGYHTRAYLSGPHLLEKAGYSRGFESFNANVRIMSIAPRVSQVLTWLDEAPEQPFFLFVQGYDAHFPCAAPSVMAGMYDQHPERHLSSKGCGANRPTPEWSCASSVVRDQATWALEEQASQGNDESVSHVVSHYDASIRYADLQLGRLLHGLSERKMLDDAIVVVLSDHGEVVDRAPFFDKGYGCGDEVFQVPLVIHVPGNHEPERFEQVVSLADVYPTLARLIGAVAPGGIQGVSLHEALSRPLPAHDSTAVVTSASKTCYWARSDSWSLRGELANSALAWSLRADDAGNDVLSENPGIAQSLHASVASWPGEYLVDPACGDIGVDKRTRRPSGHRGVVTCQSSYSSGASADPKLREALREGGYWDEAGER
jgi:arylsulfatase A-like enzyme